MSPTIASYEELTAMLAERRSAGAMLTNFYINETKHTLWIDKGLLSQSFVGDTLFLAKKDSYFSQVFFVTTSAEALQRDLTALSPDADCLVIDVVGKSLTSVDAAIVADGYSLVCRLMRMSRKTPICESDDPVEMPTTLVQSHLLEINYLLNTYFDHTLEQLPLIEELEALNDGGNILVEMVDNRVAAFVVYELSASTLYLRYWFVHPDFRGRGLGSKILKRFFDIGRTTRRQMLWVIESNINSLDIYRHYGFAPDGLVDNIYVKGNYTPNPLTTNNIKL